MDTLNNLGTRLKRGASKAREAAANSAVQQREAEASRRAAETLRLSQPATTADIERLIHAVNTGWVGRGFAIGLGTAVLGFVAGLIWLAVTGGV
jgi:hypothetical protein